MNIIALRTCRADGITLRQGEVYSLPEPVARELIVIERAVELQFPRNPQRGQSFTDPIGRRWIYAQPRDPDGQFSPDNPQTSSDEAAFRWLPE